MNVKYSDTRETQNQDLLCTRLGHTRSCTRKVFLINPPKRGKDDEIFIIGFVAKTNVCESLYRYYYVNQQKAKKK